jgi:hypothetical protein
MTTQTDYKALVASFVGRGVTLAPAKAPKQTCDRTLAARIRQQRYRKRRGDRNQANGLTRDGKVPRKPKWTGLNRKEIGHAEYVKQWRELRLKRKAA